MMDIKISKSDVIWGYVAVFFSLGTGLISLPLILKLLSPEEVGLNYILISITSIVALFDLGFTGQFSRYLTYIFSGAQEIKKDGLSDKYDENVNYRLLVNTIVSAKRIYLLFAIVALLMLSFLGTPYVCKITNHFTIVDNVKIVWILFCLSCFFNVYFLYFNSFLQSRGLIKEARQAQVFSRVLQLTITFIMLFSGFGLLSVVVANLISPFLFRYIAYKSFYSNEIVNIVSSYKVSKNEIWNTIRILFYNAKKMAIISILVSIIGHASTLVVGAYLDLKIVASYGLLVQLVGIITSIATTYFYTNTPLIASMMVKKDNDGIRRVFGFSIFIFMMVFIVGLVGLLCCIPIFRVLKFNALLPTISVILIFYLYKFWEQIQSMYSQLLLLNNDFRFFPSSIATGIITFLSMWLILYLGLGLKGLVLAQCIPLYTYVAWKWPIYSTRKYKINTYEDVIIKPYKQIKHFCHERCFSNKR